MPKKKKYKSNKERCEELLIISHGLHHRLKLLVEASKAIQPIVDQLLPVGNKERDKFVFAAISGEFALVEHDPTK